MIEKARFLSNMSLCSEFKLENIYSGVNFCGKNVCGNFYLQEHIFADRWKNDKNRKIRKPQKFRATRQSPIQYSAMFFFEVIACALDDISNNRL